MSSVSPRRAGTPQVPLRSQPNTAASSRCTTSNSTRVRSARRSPGSNPDRRSTGAGYEAGPAGRGALQSKVNQLETLQTLQTSSAVLVRTADSAAKIRPTPKKYGILGIGLGIILGIGLAFLRDAFDTRIRTGSDLGDIFKAPLLARIPPPTKRLERDQQLVMLADPTAPGADAFRRLRMNLEFAAIGKQSQVVMVSSAVATEGKSTTFANLAVAMALGGRNVALVDLDLHRPVLARFFRIDGSAPGLSASFSVIRRSMRRSSR